MTLDNTIPSLHLRKGTAKPIHSGHPWVFADAISTYKHANLSERKAEAGDEVRVVDVNGQCLGRGFYSPKSAIAVRLITRSDVAITPAVLSTRISEALKLRREVLHLGLGCHANTLTHLSTNTLMPPTSITPIKTTSTPPAFTLSEKDVASLAGIDQQIRHVEAFAANYNMDAAEETAELRRRREELLKSAGLTNTTNTPLPLPLPKNDTKAQQNSHLKETTVYRLINSEGDGLGGLIVDVYGDVLAVQIGTIGMYRRLPILLDILERFLFPRTIVNRSDAQTQQLEEIPPPVQSDAPLPLPLPLRGAALEGPLTVFENGIQFICDLRLGQSQKTGLFLDQRENRKKFGEMAAGRDVLDVFSYSGGFSLYAARGGAKSLTLIDASEPALEMARLNLTANKIDDADLICAEWAEGFKHLRESNRQFGLMVVDPPKFSRKREQLEQALSGYRDLNAQAVRLLAPGGILFTCSCSGTVSETDFERAVAAGIKASGRRAVLLEKRSAGPDHPTPPGFDQGRYLKCLVLQVV